MSVGYDKQVSKEVKKDIKTIENFLQLMVKNNIFNPSENNQQSKEEDEFVYKYAIDLLEDLRSKTYLKSTIYSFTKFNISKEDINGFFRDVLKEEYPSLRVQDDIKSFVDSL